jgi:DnaK suppressor protein
MTDALALLENERRVTLDRLRALQADFGGIVEASKDSNADDEHDPEGATIAFERSQVDSLVRQAERRLVEIDAALDRLQARPTARTCVSCA